MLQSNDCSRQVGLQHHHSVTHHFQLITFNCHSRDETCSSHRAPYSGLEGICSSVLCLERCIVLAVNNDVSNGANCSTYTDDHTSHAEELER